MKKNIAKKRGAHWTSESIEDFQSRITFDFIAQLEKRMKAEGWKRRELAGQLGVTAGAVSQILNNPDNLELKTIIGYSRALGLKVAVVAYSDDDPDNDRGPVNSEIFNLCWESRGRPLSFFDWAESQESPQLRTFFKSSGVKTFMVETDGSLYMTDAWTKKIEQTETSTRQVA